MVISLGSFSQSISWKNLFEVYKSSNDIRTQVIMNLGFNSKGEKEINKLIYSNYERKMLNGAQGEWYEYITTVKGSNQVVFTTENTTLFDKLKNELISDYGFEQNIGETNKNSQLQFVRDSSKIILFSQMNDENTLTKHLIKIVKYYENEKPILAIKNKEKNPEQQNLTRGNTDPLSGINMPKPKKMKIGNYVALIIGIDKYSGSWHPLNNAVHDAKAVEKMLQSNYKLNRVYSLFDQQATRSAIYRVFERLVDSLQENDNLVIYYSGHGEKKLNLNKGYWVPADAKSNSADELISCSDLQTFLGSMKTIHTLLIADACFSGDIFRGNAISIPFEESDKYYNHVYSKSSRQALTSGGDEPVMDGGKDGHSVFAYYLLKTLETNQNKYLDITQVYNNLKVPVINNSDQTPRLDPIKNTGDEGGQFIFMKK